MNIFFSWQSDSPSKRGRSFISDGIEGAIKSLVDISPNLQLDQALRNETGAKNIVDSICQKIAEADVFIADVSLVYKANKFELERPACNPNVLFETGYAVAYLGWERIILAFNEELGSKEKLPFDLAKNRLLLYNAEDDKSSIIKKLDNSIRLIVEKLPPKSGVLWRRELDAKKREKTVRTVKRILSKVDMDLFNDFFENMPYKFPKLMNRMLPMIFDAARTDKFEVFDEYLEQELTALVQDLNDLSRQLGYYLGPSPFLNDNYYHWKISDHPVFEVRFKMNEEQERLKDEYVVPKMNSIQKSYFNVLKHLKKHYVLEIDFQTDTTKYSL